MISAKELGQLLGQRQPVSVHRNGDAAPLHVGEHFVQIGNEQRLAVDARRYHRLRAGEFVQHLARGVEIHDALERIDLILVLKTPDRAHVAAQIAAGGKIDQQPVGHLRNRQRLPIVFGIDPVRLRPIAHFGRRASLVRTCPYVPSL